MPTDERLSRTAAILVLAWTAALLFVSVFLHPTPLYFVETDLLGEYLPAAREWLSGRVDLGHYAYKGPGYPLLLALFAWPLHGDTLLAARILSPLAAGLAAWIAWRIARALIGGTVGGFVLLAMLVAPIQMRYAIEGGTDMPALALMLASTWLLLGATGARARLAAGLLAGLSVVTRTNAVFLFPCALVVLALEPGRARAMLAYVVGAALPVGAWSWYAAAHGGLPPDRNYLNVAWELYGQGVPWDRFEATAGARFHSMADVLLFDPLRALARIGRNLLTQRWEDLWNLTTPWLGALALPGLVILARNPRARLWLLHGFACALVLAPVFYNARFGLYLLPLEVAGSGATLAWLAARLARESVPGRNALIAFGAALLLVAGGTGVVESVSRLRDAPHETRIGGRALAAMGLSGQKILTRKPHVAFYSGMQAVALPLDVRLPDLPRRANADSVRYLFYSGIEQVQRPEWGVLADSGTTLPGFRQVLWQRLTRNHFHAVYQLTAVDTDSATFAAAYAAALVRYEAHNADSPAALLFLAVQYLELGDPRAALARLDRLEQGGARDASVSRYRCVALEQMGDLDGAARACEAAMRFAPPTSWHWVKLGQIRARQGKQEEARSCFAHAVELSPTSLEYRVLLGRAQIETRQFAEAAHTFEQCARMAPRDVTAWRYAIGAWQLAGNQERMQALYREGLAAGFTPEELSGAKAR